MATSGILQRCRRQSVFENVERFVQVRAGMLGRHASAEADPMLRHGWIIDRRHPKPALSQFMPEPIHAFPVANDYRHHVRCRCSGVDAETMKLRMKVIRIFPEPPAQFWLTCPELERFQNRRYYNRRKRARINIRVRVKTKVLQCVF